VGHGSFGVAGCAGASMPIGSVGLAVERFTLANGLRVVLHADHTVPTVAISLFYDVGSRNEVEGRSGFAHMFEHMMFEGTANLPKGEFAKLIWVDLTPLGRRPLARRLTPSSRLIKGGSEPYQAGVGDCHPKYVLTPEHQAALEQFVGWTLQKWQAGSCVP
jgi:hypothetical protein